MHSSVVRPMPETKPLIHLVKGRDWLILLLILIVGGLLRFANADLIDWSKDHSDMAMIAQDIVAGKGIPLVGQPSSAVIPHSPFYIYVLVLPYLLSNDPVVACMFIAFLNLIGVGLLWFIVHRYLSPRAAIIAGLAYAVHPWVVGYSRSFWGGDHRAPLFLLALLIGLLGFYEGKRWAQILCLPLMFIALQIHYAAWVLFPVYLWLVWSGRKYTNWRTLGISAVLGVLVMLPFTIGTIQTLTDDTRLVTNFQGQRRELSLRNLIKPYGQLAWLMTGLGTEQYTARERAAEFTATVPYLPTFLWVLQGVATVVGVAVLWLRFSRTLSVAILLWAFMPPLFFTLPLLDVVPHYLIPSIAAYCLLAGIGVDWIVGLVGRRSAVLQYAVWAVFGLIFISQGLYFRSLLFYVDANYTPSQFGFGTPIRYILEARDALENEDDIVVIGTGDWNDISKSGSWVWAPFLRDTSVKCLRDITLLDKAVVFPSGPFGVLYAPRMPQDPLLDALYETDSPTTIALRPGGEGEYRIGHLESATEWSGLPLTAVGPVTYENGVSLTGYTLLDDQLTLEWALPAATKLDYQYVITFYSAEGNALGSQKTSFWPSKNWCEGDRLVNWTDVTLPQGTQSIQVGLERAAGEIPVAVTGNAEARLPVSVA